jgi:hypothetical protein
MLAVILGGQHYSLCNAVRLRVSSLADVQHVDGKAEEYENIDLGHHANGEEVDEKGLDLFDYENNDHVFIDTEFNIPAEERTLAEVENMMETDVKYLERLEFEQSFSEV